LPIIIALDCDVLNIPDHLGLLPIAYAALMGNSKFVLELIKLNSHITSKKRVASQAIEKFSKLLPNLDKLKVEIFDHDDLRKINILTNQIKKDFNV
jgi:hypothetical protein